MTQAYEIMEALFNYKRTVEDFQRCGSKSPNPYNFPFVSDCVGVGQPTKCDDASHPVPCADGSCQSDYITCLKVLSKGEQAMLYEKEHRDAEKKASRLALQRLALQRLQLVAENTNAVRPPTDAFISDGTLRYSSEGLLDN